MTSTWKLLVISSLVGCEGSAVSSAHVEALNAERVADADRDQEEVVLHPVGEVVLASAAEEYGHEPWEDRDGDGVVARDDPDDENRFQYPGAIEQPCSGVDEDGDGVDPCPLDVDGDGAAETIDCDDLNPEISPWASDAPCDGRDGNCNGIDDCDRDSDGADDAVDAAPDDPDVGGEQR